MLQQAFPTNRDRYARSPKYSVSASGLLPRHNDLNKVLSSIGEISLFMRVRVPGGEAKKARSITLLNPGQRPHAGHRNKKDPALKPSQTSVSL